MFDEFSGNSLVPAFSLGLFDLFGLVYDLGSGGLGDEITLDVEGVGAVDAIYFYAAGNGPLGFYRWRGRRHRRRLLRIA